MHHPNSLFTMSTRNTFDYPESNTERLETPQVETQQLSEGLGSCQQPETPSAPASPELFPSHSVLETISVRRGATGSTSRGTTPKAKATKNKLTDEEEEIMLAEIRAARAHIAPHGKTLELFEVAAKEINANPMFKGTVNGRCLNDRYKRRMASFLGSDRKNAAASGVGGGVTAVEKMLLEMNNASEAMKEVDKAKKNELNEAEKAKLAAGKRLIAEAVGEVMDEEGDKSGGEEKSEDEGEKTECKLKGRKRRRLNSQRAVVTSAGDGLDKFGQSMRETELAEIQLKERQLDFEKKKHEDMLVERQRDRESDKQKEELRSKLELEKMKVMMQTMMSGMQAMMEEKSKK